MRGIADTIFGNIWHALNYVKNNYTLGGTFKGVDNDRRIEPYFNL
jgi:hypothetical protein